MPYDVKLDRKILEKKDNIRSKKVCAIDPGISTFMTSFSTNRTIKYDDTFIDPFFKVQDKL